MLNSNQHARPFAVPTNRADLDGSGTRPVATLRWLNPRRSDARWLVAQAATAALILITVIAALTLSRIDEPPSREAIVSAPAGAIVTESLFDDPVDALPGGPASLWVMLCTIQPGATMAEEGVVGSLLFASLNEPLRVSLSNGERTLNSGEILSGSTTAGYSAQNLGDSVSEIVHLQILNSTKTTSATQSDPTEFTCDRPISVGATLPSGPGWARLERVTLPVGATAPSQLATGSDWIGVESGRLGVRLEGDTLPFRWNSGEEREFGAGQQLPTFAGGTRVTVRNADDVPVEMIRLAITPITGSDTIRPSEGNANESNLLNLTLSEFPSMRAQGKIDVTDYPPGGRSQKQTLTSTEQKFAPDRSFLLAWGSEGKEDGQFMNPNGIAIDAIGSVYVTDEVQGDIQVFDPTGRLLRTIGEPGYAEGKIGLVAGVGIGPNGDVWIAEYGADPIQRFNPAGDLLDAWGEFGTSGGELDNPNDVAVDAEGRVHVADDANGRQQVFTTYGEFLAEAGGLRSEPGTFNDSLGVAVGPDGTVNASGRNGLQAFRLMP